MVAYGLHDTMLTGNPQISFFKTVYRKHTHFYKESIEQTYSGDLILNEKGEPIFDENGIALRKSDTTKDMGIVTLKGTDLFTDNMGGTIRYQKDWGNKYDNLFFTAGAEKDLFNDDYTYGAGLKYIFAKGGIANHFRKK